MRRTIAIILALCLAALLPGCGTKSEGPVTSGASSNPSSVEKPDYTNTDFSGHWAVSQVFDSAGEAVSSDRLAELGGFTLELLMDGTYFVYDASGAVLGQGRYTVQKDVMTLEAGGVQTIYTVTDQDTLSGATSDGSVTILTRQPEPAPAVEEEEPVDDTAEGEDVTTSPEETEEDIDIPDDDSTVTTDAA
jgi:hypothetical protein